MRSPLGIIIFLSIVVLMNVYAYRAIKTVGASWSVNVNHWVWVVFLSLTILQLLGYLTLFVAFDSIPKVIRSYFFATLAGIFFTLLIIVFFLLIDDVRRLVTWVLLNVGVIQKEMTSEGQGITRSVFLSWLGLASGAGLFGSLLYGFGNKYKYTVKNVKLNFDQLPDGLKGMKIIQISDIHSGSFNNKKAVERGVEMIMQLQADLILFTGDLVNDRATEMNEYKDVFSKLKAPLGVYSILGNHDYGDYVKWPFNGVSKEKNLENLIQLQKEMGWRVLKNEHVEIARNGDKMALLGIENWSVKARFPKYGKMNEAHQGTEGYPFKILMSHDPSHWDAQVRPDYPDVDLMLSGHTHGMQFGLELPGFKWSPVQLMYKQWSGLYEQGRQKLYVNTGFGFLGYPGRVGFLPEITMIELA